MHEETTVVVRHVPQFLGRDQMDSLFNRLGGVGVRFLASKTKKTGTAFVNFRSLPEAECAVTRLHQMDVRGFRLSAELSHKTILNDRIPAGQSDFLRQKEADYLSLLKRPGLDNCPPNGLKYKYPQPTLYVLLNIMSALVEHQKFYTQVLHLMNKMNLVCPFKKEYKRLEMINKLFLHGREFSETQLEAGLEELEEVIDKLEEENPHKPPNQPQQARSLEPPNDTEETQDIAMQLVEQSESDTEDEAMESELEEDEEDREGEVERASNMAAVLTLKKAMEKKKGKGVKRPKFIKPMLSGQRAVKRKRDESEVFETSTSSSALRRKILVKVSSNLSSITSGSEANPVPELESVQSYDQAYHASTSERVEYQKPFMESTCDPKNVSQKPSDELISEPNRVGQSRSDTNEPISTSRSSFVGENPRHPIESSKDQPLSRRLTESSQPPGKTEDCLPQENVQTTVRDLPEIGLSNDPTIELFSSVPMKTGVETKARQDNADEVSRVARVIAKERLDENRLSEKDRRFVKAFTNYTPGTPSCRLYVKNLAKQVTQADLEYIYHRYYLPEYKEQGTMFDIRLMQEGRMKGQAFVTLQTVAQAKQALEETNGFILKDKPMVVQFARSIQAKPAQ